MNTPRYNVIHKFILGSDLETQSPKLNSIEDPYMLQNQAQARPKSRQALPLGVFNEMLLGLRCFNSLFSIKEEHPNLESKIVHCIPMYKSHKISIHMGQGFFYFTEPKMINKRGEGKARHVCVVGFFSEKMKNGESLF